MASQDTGSSKRRSMADQGKFIDLKSWTIENFKKQSVLHKSMLKTVFDKFVTEITTVTEERKSTSIKLNSLIADLRKQLAASDAKVKELE